MKTIKDKQILVGADFAGFPLKEAVVAHLKKKGWTVTDVGVRTGDEEDTDLMFHRIGLRVFRGDFRFRPRDDRRRGDAYDPGHDPAGIQQGLCGCGRGDRRGRGHHHPPEHPDGRLCGVGAAIHHQNVPRRGNARHHDRGGARRHAPLPLPEHARGGRSPKRLGGLAAQGAQGRALVAHGSGRHPRRHLRGVLHADRGRRGRHLLLHLRRAVHPPRADVRGDPALAPDHLMDDRARADHHVHGLRVRAAARPVPDTRHDCGAHPRLHLGRRRHLDVRHRPAALSGDVHGDAGDHPAGDSRTPAGHDRLRRGPHPLRRHHGGQLGHRFRDAARRREPFCGQRHNEGEDRAGFPCGGSFPYRHVGGFRFCDLCAGNFPFPN